MRFPVVILLSLFKLAQGDQHCERLKASLTYTQEEAPRDLSEVLPVVVERVNQALEGVVDVEVDWTGGDLHGTVGEHIIECRVTRLASVVKDGEVTFTDEQGVKVATQCFHVPFTILDSNECKLPVGHRMRHQCHHSALCINTIGSYECVCPRNGMVLPDTADEHFWEALAAEERSPWALSFNSTSRTSCPGAASTHGCCPDQVYVKDGGSTCRTTFRCPIDPCISSTKNDCASSASCLRTESPLSFPNYQCKCPVGLMGNGHKCKADDPKPEPKVTYDGVTPTEETVKNNFYCDCTKPIIDACAGFPPCQGKHEVCTLTAGNLPKCMCKPGYIMHEKYGCVDEKPPILRLKNDPSRNGIMRLKQGDFYKEYAVEIEDENAEEYMRSLKIAYSRPIPHGCLSEIGEFYVNYTIATPWTTPSFARVTRRVIIEDIDECTLDVSKYEKTCPQLVPKCDTEAGATCRNTIGSYKCECPKYTIGDGFIRHASFVGKVNPVGFKDGSSCVDTSKPVIELQGPDPKVFRVCECGGINGIMNSAKKSDSSDLREQQQTHYESDIVSLIKKTAGAELCATPGKPNPRPYDCVKAYDETYRGKVDLSRNVTVGEPKREGALRWSVPYNVQDRAGNKATTVWRQIVVEEVDANELEAKLRRELLKEKEQEIQAAIEADRKRRGGSSARPAAGACPSCPKCEGQSFDPKQCDSYCKGMMDRCAIDEHGLVAQLLFSLESIVPASVASILIAILAGGLLLFFFQWVFSLARKSQVYGPDYYYMSDERERALQNAVTNYNGTNGRAASYQRNVGQEDSFFTPRNVSFGPSQQPQSASRESDSIYATDPIITPSKTGDGVLRRRSPYAY